MHYEVETVGPTHYSTWQIIVSETSDAVLGSIGSPALCCTQKRNPLFEIILSTGLTTIYMQKKPRMQQSNKAAREECPSEAGEELFYIIHKLLRTSWRSTGPAPGTQEQSLPQVRQDETLHVGEARVSLKTGFHFTSAWAHENIRPLLLIAVVFRRARSSDIHFLRFLVWRTHRCLVYGAAAVTEDYLHTRIQAPCNNIQTPCMFERQR
jgi:hypothetical protein